MGTYPKVIQNLRLADMTLKITMINMFKKTEKKMKKIYEKIKDFTELKYVRENQMHILELKNTRS